MNIETIEQYARASRYREAQIQKARAYAEYDAASNALTIAQIRERCAELSSQSFVSIGGGKLEDQLGELTDREREIGIAFAQYAVFGRTDITL